jgi:hypothetical protein
MCGPMSEEMRREFIAERNRRAAKAAGHSSSKAPIVLQSKIGGFVFYAFPVRAPEIVPFRPFQATRVEMTSANLRRAFANAA